MIIWSRKGKDRNKGGKIIAYQLKNKKLRGLLDHDTYYVHTRVQYINLLVIIDHSSSSSIKLQSPYIPDLKFQEKENSLCSVLLLDHFFGFGFGFALLVRGEGNERKYGKPSASQVVESHISSMSIRGGVHELLPARFRFSPHPETWLF